MIERTMKKKRVVRPQVFQDPASGAPMVVTQIPRAPKPTMRYGCDYLPGTGYVKIKPVCRATPWRGGIFGQPPIPHGRMGIFKDYWAIPPDQSYDDTGIFTPFKQLRIPGSSMDSGMPLSTYLAAKRRARLDAIKAAKKAQAPSVADSVGLALAGLGQTAEETVSTAAGVAKGFFATIGDIMFGTDPEVRSQEKRAWLRVAALSAMILWAAKKSSKTS